MRSGTASDEHARAPRKRRKLAALTLGGLVLLGAPWSFAGDECLLQVKAAGGAVAADHDTLCAEAQSKVCTFQLQLCLNQADGTCTAAAMKKKVKARGKCGAIGKLRVKPDGTATATCGSLVGVKVKTKKKGKREGKCQLHIVAKSADKPARRDVDDLTLICKPNPGDCPKPITIESTTTTTTTTTTTLSGPTITTTTLPCMPTACDCCVLPITDLLNCVSR